MRVGINATCFNERPSGARHRFITLYGAVFRSLADLEFVIYEPSDCRLSQWFPDLQNLTYRKTNIPSTGGMRKNLASFSYWSERSRDEKFDVFEVMHLPLLYTGQSPILLTIHDIRALTTPRGLAQFLFAGKVGKHALERSKHVLTVSHAMRSEMLGIYPDLNISVIYNGVNIEKYKNINFENARKRIQKYKLNRKYILSVGHLEARKNYATLLKAIALLKSRGEDVFLVIVGNDSGEGRAIHELIFRLKLDNNVKVFSGICEEDLISFYFLCELFIFPSTYEGFGIPLIEAMAAKKPTVVSDIPVFREITEGKSFFFQPESEEDIANTILRALSSSEERTKVVEHGSQRVSAFSVDRLALQLSDIYVQGF